MNSRLQLVFLLLLGGFVYAIYEYYEFTSTEVPRLEAEQKAAENRFTMKRNELQRLREFAENIERVKQELKELNLQLESALEHMPRTFNLSGLLRRLTMLAQNSGVELSTFRPNRGETKGEGGFYSTITIDFDMRGTFTQCLVFFDQVSRLKRIINIESLKMQAQNSTGSRAGGLLADTTGTIRTYRFIE